MKKSKVFMATAALVLAATAIFATKANKKFFGQVLTAYAGTTGSIYTVQVGSGTVLLMTTYGHNAGGVANLQISGGPSLGGLKTTAVSGHAIYFH